MPASRAAVITATPASRGMRSKVRHDPSARRETSIPERPSGACASPPTNAAGLAARLAPRLVSRDGEADEQRHVDGVDDERQGEHDEHTAAGAVLDEDELEHAGDDDVGDERPPRDAEERGPVEAGRPAQPDEIDGHDE